MGMGRGLGGWEWVESSEDGNGKSSVDGNG